MHFSGVSEQAVRGWRGRQSHACSTACACNALTRAPAEDGKAVVGSRTDLPLFSRSRARHGSFVIGMRSSS